MAEAAAGAVVEEVVKLVVPPIKRGFNYLCCFTSNINNLEKEAEELEAVAKGIEMKVETALNAGRVKGPTVDNWLAESKKIKDEKAAILDQVPNVGSVCLNLGARFSLSKRATKTAERMKKLRDECKFDVVSLPGHPMARKGIPLGNPCEFESRKQIEEAVMKVLRDGEVSLIGIYGMGGVGKTTMADIIRNRVLKEHVFQEAVFAAFGQKFNKLQIQVEIARSLGLTTLTSETSEDDRKKLLHGRLSGTERNTESGTRRILLVLDDVWEGIELEEFGIPRDSKGCTILITSRNKDTLSTMDVQEDFVMESLSDEDARILFRKKAGACMDDAKVKSIAEGVVKKCGGLPIALATVGAALKDMKDPRVWRDALNRLRRRNPSDSIGKVYNPFKLSYDFLNSKEAESLFLLCCLFPEDSHIDVEILTSFGMGLGIFEGVKDLEEVRDRVSTLINMLRGRSLLLESVESDDHVRMHDLVRDAGISIAKQERLIACNNCPWISSYEMLEERTKPPTGLVSQNLRLLFLSPERNYKSREDEAFKFDIAFFEGNSDLHVLCIQKHRSLISLPHSLKNLKSLVFDSCYGLETLSFIGGFESLEILICRDCPSIEELPLEIKGLKQLKLLDLTHCTYLQRIPQGIVSSLIGLEELKMLHSFNKWESEDKEDKENARLKELEALTNLICLEIQIWDPALVAEKIHLPPKIKRFRIRICKYWDRGFEFNDDSYDKIMALKLEREEPCSRNSISLQLLRDTEYLYLKGNGANSVDLAKCKNVRWLKLKDCETLNNILTSSMVDDATELPTSVEHLKLSKLPKLEGICDGPNLSNSFHNLKELKLSELVALKELWKSSSCNIYNDPPVFANLSSIKINRCGRLCNLGELSLAGRDCLPQLQELVIKECEMMEQVFLWNKEYESRNDHRITKVFPKLKKVELDDLPNLATFYQGIGGIEFPLLVKLSISGCPKLKCMGINQNSGGSNADFDDDASQHLFCRPKKVSLANLKELSLASQLNPFCGHEIHESLLIGLEVLRFSSLYCSTSLLSSLIAKNLINLRVLEIQSCDEMLKVIEDNMEEDEEEKVVSFGNDSESQSHHCITKVFSKLKKVIKCDEMLKVMEDNKEEDEEEKVVSGTAQMPPNLFPKLEELKLYNLPKLVTFCEWNFKFPLLTRVTVKRCPDMENLGFLAAPNLDAFNTDFNNNLGANVSFDSLKRLEISFCEKPFCGHKFFESIFKGLKEFRVTWFSGIYLFTSYVARHLDSLEVLVIDSACHKMVKVIEDEENEEKVGSGGCERSTLLFPNLKTLHLGGLRKLKSFCEWKCDIELPSLRKIEIWGCDVLRNFTMGSIAYAPKLEIGKLDYYEDIVGGTKDLNSVVRQYMELKRRRG